VVRAAVICELEWRRLDEVAERRVETILYDRAEGQIHRSRSEVGIHNEAFEVFAEVAGAADGSLPRGTAVMLNDRSRHDRRDHQCQNTYQYPEALHTWSSPLD
jgi:hypothetical protein